MMISHNSSTECSSSGKIRANGSANTVIPLRMKSHAWRDSLQPYSDPIRIEETSLLMLTRSAARIRN
jgi:hypothetical protein